MLINVIGCGESASKWDGSGDSIGVNDAFKWGKKLQRLVLLNTINEFSNEQDRLETIRNTNANFVYTCWREWQRELSNIVYFNYHVWQGRLLPKGTKQFQTSQTSPFCAISIAYNLGYDEIVLWGVDFKTHPIWNQTHHNFAYEIKNYQQLCEQLKIRGVMVYSSELSILKLPVYNWANKMFEEQKQIKELFT